MLPRQAMGALRKLFTKPLTQVEAHPSFGSSCPRLRVRRASAFCRYFSSLSRLSLTIEARHPSHGGAVRAKMQLRLRLCGGKVQLRVLCLGRSLQPRWAFQTAGLQPGRFCRETHLLCISCLLYVPSSSFSTQAAILKRFPPLREGWKT